MTALGIRQLCIKLGSAFVAAVLTGILAGIGLRVIMKIIALAFPDMARGFTWNGTLALVIVGVGFCLANSLIFACIDPILPKWWLTKGLLYGGLNLVLYGIPFFLSNPDNDLFGPQSFLGIALFAILFIVGGIMLAYSVERVRNWVHAKEGTRSRFMFLMSLLFIVPAVIQFSGIFYELFFQTIPEIGAQWL